jgi:hypothetical protein
MTTRIIRTDEDRKLLLRRIEKQKLPFTVQITKGANRSVEQNRLQRLWMTEIAEQFGDRTAEEVRGFCKLHIGVPILRAEDEAFRERYDAVVKPLPYQMKLMVMMEPLDLPVTRIMTSEQKHRYLDEIFRQFSEQGIVLTIPEDKRYGAAA